MKKLVLTYGAIGGIVVTASMLISFSLLMRNGSDANMGTSEIIGYLSMLVALSVIFFGIRSYRDNHLSGKISFGNAFKTGLLITLVASTIYVAGWMVYYSTSPNAQQFMETYKTHKIEAMKAENAPQEKIDEATVEMDEMAEAYKNPLIRAAFTYIEILPVGLLITVLSSFLLKTKPGE